MIFFGGKRLWISCSMIHKNIWCQCSKSNDYHEYFQWDCSWSWTALFLEAIESIIPFKPFLWTGIWKLFIVLYFIPLYIHYGIKMFGWVIATMLSTLLREEGMLQIAFNGFHKKSGLLTRGNTIRQKGKIFSTWLRTKFPGKWFPGVPASGSVGVACKPTCCLLSPSFNEYTRNCSLGTKKAQIGDKISAPAPRQSDTGVVADQTVLEPKFGRFLCLRPARCTNQPGWKANWANSHDPA